MREVKTSQQQTAKMVVDEVQNGVYTYKAFLLLLTMGLLDSFDMIINAYNILIC